jgi:hypothetical protein
MNVKSYKFGIPPTAFGLLHTKKHNVNKVAEVLATLTPYCGWDVEAVQIRLHIGSHYSLGSLTVVKL